MGMKRCESGHYYDAGKHVVCPLCAAVDVAPKPVQAAAVQAPPQPRAGAPISPQDAGKTVGVMKKEKGIDPVVGWLVCVAGPERGADFRLRGEKNYIGRANTMDVCIARDETVSRENHAAVSYNPKKKTFKILPGEGRGLVYLNGDEVDGPMDIRHGDKIELGQTSLMFVPLCGEEFDWE